MPTYDYICKKCGKTFTLVLSLSEHEKKKVHCPKCQSTRVEQQILSCSMITSKKSWG